jgi:hypothetical protein
VRVTETQTQSTNLHTDSNPAQNETCPNSMNGTGDPDEEEEEEKEDDESVILLFILEVSLIELDCDLVTLEEINNEAECDSLGEPLPIEDSEIEFVLVSVLVALGVFEIDPLVVGEIERVELFDGVSGIVRDTVREFVAQRSK